MILIVVLFLLDRYSKSLSGVTFTSAPLTHPVVLLLVLVALVVLWWGERKGIVQRNQATIITLGVVSNLNDVIFFGHVIDYLPIGQYTTNIADAMIVVGAIVAIVQLGQGLNEQQRQS